jgi:hypothetical protein
MTTYVPVSKIVDRLIRLSGQVPGTSVQVYSQDVFIDLVNTTVRIVARKCWWPHLMWTHDGSLDGANGVLTNDVTNVQDHTDIKAVFVDEDPYPLPRFSPELNLANFATGDKPCGYAPLPFWHEFYKARLIRIFPPTAKGFLHLHVRTLPIELGFNDIVVFDQDLIVFGTMWMYFEDEGDNPQQASKYKALFDAKYAELVSAMSTHRVSLDNNRPYAPYIWQEV